MWRRRARRRGSPSRRALELPANLNHFYAEREAADTSHVRLALSYASLAELEDVGPRFLRAFQRVVD